MKSIQQLQQVIHYQFHNITFLEVALTHSSYANEMRHQVRYNERQEFLGDAVLSIIVSDYLFNQLHRAGRRPDQAACRAGLQTVRWTSCK